MYFGDHPPPHFHVITRSEQRVAVLIDPVSVRAGDADIRDIREAIQWAKANQKSLRLHWKLYSGGARP